MAIYWVGFVCVECGDPVSDKSADLYINPNGIKAIHKNARICWEIRQVKAIDNTTDNG